MHAGNLYINRGTTGAIVLRQPFGGMGRSVFGPGLKAGGPNYVAQFITFADRPKRPVADAPLPHPDLQAMAEQLTRLGDTIPLGRGRAPPRRAAARTPSGGGMNSAGSHDHFRLLGQDNERRYLPFDEIRVRVCEGDDHFEIFARRRPPGSPAPASSSAGRHGCAARTVDVLGQATKAWADRIDFIEESDAELVGRDSESCPPMPTSAFASPHPTACRQPASRRRRVRRLSRRRASPRPRPRRTALGTSASKASALDYHRYGNLGSRAGETRREPV